MTYVNTICFIEGNKKPAKAGFW